MESFLSVEAIVSWNCLLPSGETTSWATPRTSPAEFFAVATEFFFEDSRRLLARYPELYDQLRLFYRQDPASLIEQDPAT